MITTITFGRLFMVSVSSRSAQAPSSPAAGGGGASADAGLQVAAQRRRQEEGALPHIVAALARTSVIADIHAGIHLQPGRQLPGRSTQAVQRESVRKGRSALPKWTEHDNRGGSSDRVTTMLRFATARAASCRGSVSGSRSQSGLRVRVQVGWALGFRQTSCDELSRTWSSFSDAGFSAAELSLVTPISEPAASMSCGKTHCTSRPMV